MNIFIKLTKIIIKIIFPEKVGNSFIYKSVKTKNILTSTKELKLLFYVLTLPFNLIISLAIAFLKIILVWILPVGIYGNLKYLFEQLYNDVSVRQMSIALAYKRLKLCYQIFAKGNEKSITCGENHPDCVFYVIRPYYYMQRNELTLNVSNLMVHYYRVLEHVAYAVEKGWIPVVDWENYGPFPHEEAYAINGTKNCWEYYWNQPSEYSLQEVYQSKNVVLSVRNVMDVPFLPSAFFKPPLQKQAQAYAALCPKYDQLISRNCYTENYINEKQKLIFPLGGRILGVSIRGTAYGVDKSSTNIQGHPVQPDLTTLIKEIEKYMIEWNMEYVFIACELESVIEIIKCKFGEKVLNLPRLRYKKSPKRGDVEKGLDPLYVPGQKYQTNLDYLTEMVLLSRCTALLAAMSSGVRVAIIWNNCRYENMKIFENGLW